jgi:cytochrome c oxidase subunit II
MLVVVVLVASGIGIALGLAIDWFPAQGSTIAHKIDTFWDVLIIASVPIFVLVSTVVLFSIWRWRMRPGEEDLDGPPTHGSTRLEVIWTALPTIIIAGLCAYATVLLLDIQDSPARGTRVVNVTGQQFAWTFETRENGKRLLANHLVLPIGEAVQFKVHSKDVIHDFWVPEWRLKVDAVPGITTEYSLTPSKLGRYQVVCAELCGLGHAFMRQTVTIVRPAEYAAYVRKLTAPAAALAGGGATAAAPSGKQLFVAGNPQTGATSCGSCHTLAAASTTGQTGPNLDSALKADDAAGIREMIADPGKEIAKGYGANIMPPNYAQTLTPQQLSALVTFIDQSVHGGK